MCDFRLAELKFGGVLRAKRREVGAKIFLRSHARNAVATGASFFEEEALAILDFVAGRGFQLGYRGEQIRIRQLVHDVLRDLVEVFIRPAVARHIVLRQVALRVAQPGDEPRFVDLAAHFGQFGPMFPPISFVSPARVTASGWQVVHIIWRKRSSPCGNKSGFLFQAATTAGLIL